jgi:2-aminoadipate transaminase
LIAAILYEYFRDTLWDHVDRTNATVKVKRDAMIESLAKAPDAFEWFSRPKGGLFIWVKLPDATDLAACQTLADSRGIEYATGKAFNVNDEDVPYIRLAFGYPTPDQIRKGIAKLADCIREAQRTPSHAPA